MGSGGGGSFGGAGGGVVVINVNGTLEIEGVCYFYQLCLGVFFIGFVVELTMACPCIYVYLCVDETVCDSERRARVGSIILRSR